MMATDDEPLDAEFRSSTAALVPQSAQERLPAVLSPKQAREELEAFQALKASLAQPGDFQEFIDKKSGAKHSFAKKRLVKNLAMAFRVSVQIVKTEVDQLPGNHIGVRIVARATRLSGAFAEASGACSTLEARFEKSYDKGVTGRNYHDCVSTAETRATNRAVLNLIGGGEVSAEEMAAEKAALAGDTPTAAPEPPSEPGPTIEDYRVAWEAAGKPEGTGRAFLAKHGGTLTGAMAALDSLATADAIEADEPDPLEKERRRMFALAKDRNVSDDVRRAIMLRLFGAKCIRNGKPSSTALNHAQLVQLNFEMESA
jgi:hypothetical protein